MQCPKCKSSIEDGSKECIKCGIIIEKYIRHLERQGKRVEPQPDRPTTEEFSYPSIPSGNRSRRLIWLISVACILSLYFIWERFIREKPPPVERSREFRTERTVRRPLRMSNYPRRRRPWRREAPLARSTEESHTRKSKDKLIEQHIENGKMYMKRGSYYTSILEFEKALKIDETNGEVYLLMAEAYEKMKNRRRAIDTLRRGLKVNERNIGMMVKLADYYYEDNELEKAEKLYEKAFSIKPGHRHIAMKLRDVRKEMAVGRLHRMKESRHFNVIFNGREDLVVGHIVINMLEDAYDHVCGKLRYRPSGRITAILYTDVEFRYITEAPDWVAARFDGKIRLPVRGIKRSSSRLRSILYHEFTHAVVAEMTDGRCPRWLNEGLAEYMEDSSAAWKIRKFCSQKVYIPLSRLEGRWSGQVVGVAYRESLLVVKHIVERYGMREIKRILNLMRDGESSKSALKKVLRLTHQELLDEAIRHYCD